MKLNGLLAFALGATLASAAVAQDSDRSAAARQLAAQVMIVDTHVDVPYRLEEKWEDVTRATENGNFDYVRAKEGGLNIPFMSIYTPAESEAEGTSYQLANQLIDSVEALVGRAQQGDARAFEEVYRRTADRVYAVCLRMCADADEASEMVQDVYVRAWQRLTSFRGDSLFTTWLHRLTVNLVLQDRRSKGRRRARERAEADLEHYARAAVVAMPGTRVDLERAIAALPTRAREVLVLRDVQGYKYDEIARMTGVSLGTVKAQIHRARGLVKEALDR